MLLNCNVAIIMNQKLQDALTNLVNAITELVKVATIQVKKEK